MSRNDYLLLEQKCLKYFDGLIQCFDGGKKLKCKDKELEDSARARLGFYLYILEEYTGEREISELTSMITDTDFNKIVFGETHDDCGIDAIYIDQENGEIKLFNFCYRETYKKDQAQSERKVTDSAPFLSLAYRGEHGDLGSDRLKAFAEEIYKAISTKRQWNTTFYLVSNEDMVVNEKSIRPKLFDEWDVKVESVAMPQIRQLMSIRPEPITACLVVGSEAMLEYSEDPQISKRSYMLRITADELIRITCNNEDLRKEYNLEDVKNLSDVDLDYSVLFDNVRGLIIRSKYNRNIEATLRDAPEKFFLYNNGLTLAASRIECEKINANRQYKLNINALQVLNGGQTLRTIHKFNQEDKRNIEEYLSKAWVLVRIFDVREDQEVINKVAEYTNSQNSISPIDLKSLAPEQIQLEQFFDSNNIIYSRKTGDTGISENKEYTYRISMEKLGQILFAIHGFPHNISNRKKDIFDETKYYRELFCCPDLMDNCLDYVKRYQEVRGAYQQGEFDDFESKVFYILYIYFNLKRNENIEVDPEDLTISNIIRKFEALLESYDKSNSHVGRKLLRKEFKKEVDEEFGLNNVQ